MNELALTLLLLVVPAGFALPFALLVAGGRELPERCLTCGGQWRLGHKCPMGVGTASDSPGERKPS